MSATIVVGGGISGILSALLLRERGEEVVLVEREPRIGGLMGSVRSPDGDSFDSGTHYLVRTGHERIDALLFPEEWLRDWMPLPFLKAGNYFRGRLNERCMFADANQLPAETYRRGVEEMLAAGDAEPEARNLRDYLLGSYGPTLTEAIFEPILVARLGLPLAELYRNGHLLIGLNRILAFDAQTSRQLKAQSPGLDRKIGFHSYLEGERPTLSYYPREGGTGEWIALLERRLVERGVTLLTGRSIRAIRHQGGRVTAVEFQDGSAMDCESIHWTLPASAFLRSCGLPTLVEPPKIRVTSHFHYSFDRPAATDLYYVLCNDAEKLAYRATLYANVQPEKAARTGRYGVTVEVLSDPLPDVDLASERVQRELVEMGVIPAAAAVTWRMSRSGVSGIPVITPKFVEQTQQQMEALQGRLGNAFLSGMVPGVSFFKREVLVQAHDQIMSQRNAERG